MVSKNRKRILSAIVAAITVVSASTGVVSDVTNGMIPSVAIEASAASDIVFVNASGNNARLNSYRKLKTSTSKLTGGYYLVTDELVTNKRLHVTKDTGIILGSGSTLICKKGIEVDSGVTLNIYTQSGITGTLYAGTTDGNSVTAGSGKCGIGGAGAIVNILGGKIYAKGGNGSYGIEGSAIRLKHTGPKDLVYSSSYSRSVDICDGFVDTNNKIYYGCSVNASSINNTKLSSAAIVNNATTVLNDDEYIVFNNVTLNDRLDVIGNVDLYLADTADMFVSEGIDVGRNDRLRIYGNKGRLSAGVRSEGQIALTDPYKPGIGAADNNTTGEIIINGGIVSAAGGQYAAGIGGNSASVKINGGSVYAKSGAYAAAIGSNYDDNGSEIKITGGKVKAIVDSEGYGMGSGCNSGKSYIDLSLRSSSDEIYSDSYNAAVTFSKTLYTSDYQTAKSDNIAKKTLKSQNTKTSVRISYNTNGAGSISSKTMYTGSRLGTLPTVYKYGYMLEGWYSDPSFTTKVTADTIVTGEMTLYANWTSVYSFAYWDYYNYYGNNWDPYYYDPTGYWNYWNNYYGYNYTGNYNIRTVSFETNGAGDISSIQVPYGTTLPRLPYVIRNGYVFDGWYTDKYYRNAFDTNQVIYSDITLYAKWISNSSYSRSCRVNFVTNGGSNVSDRIVEYGKTLGSMPYIERSGYIFSGWYADNSFTYRVNENTPIYSNTTLYAKWTKSPEISTCKVYFDACDGWFSDGSVIITKSVKSGTSAASVFPDPPIYTTIYETGRFVVFEGWYYDSSLTIRYNNEPIYSDTMLYAKYTVAPLYY